MHDLNINPERALEIKRGEQVLVNSRIFVVGVHGSQVMLTEYDSPGLVAERAGGKSVANEEDYFELYTHLRLPPENDFDVGIALMQRPEMERALRENAFTLG